MSRLVFVYSPHYYYFLYIFLLYFLPLLPCPHPPSATPGDSFLSMDHDDGNCARTLARLVIVLLSMDNASLTETTTHAVKRQCIDGAPSASLSASSSSASAFFAAEPHASSSIIPSASSWCPALQLSSAAACDPSSLTADAVWALLGGSDACALRCLKPMLGGLYLLIFCF